MPPLCWDEYACLQRRASRRHLDDYAWTFEEQLDEFLKKYAGNPNSFDLHDCRRWLKNLGRNRTRKFRQRAKVLCREAPRLVRPAAPDPFEEAARNEQLDWVKKRVSPEEWDILRAVAERLRRRRP